MNSPRPHPFTLVFGELVEPHFPAVRAIVGGRPELDAFLMAQPAIELLQQLRPDDGLGAGSDDFVALVYAAYRFWAEGSPTRTLENAATRALCISGPAAAADPAVASYIQIAPRVIWGAIEGEEHHEPLDGWFSVPVTAGLQVVAILGLHPGRPGCSVLVAEGATADLMVSREDGSPAFTPTMTGGETAGLFSVASRDELLLLARRAAGMLEDC